MAWIGLLGFAYAAFYGALAFAPSTDDGFNLPLATLILFLGLLPLTNALFDFLSYGLTLCFVRAGLGGRWGAGAGLLQRAGGWRALRFALTDIFVALIMFTLLGSALIAVIALANRLTPEPVFPLAPLFAAFSAGDGPFWVVAMLFSTALPTAIHLVLAGVSLTGFAPRGLRNWLVGLVADYPDGGQRGLIAPLALGSTWFLAGALPLVVVGGIGGALYLAFPLIGETYLQVFAYVANLLGEAVKIGPGYLPQEPFGGIAV
ncbi:MAG TPA: hypothetical protein ENK63_04865 [Rhodobacterales bacterium]|nr:hypothetical protein [Rhodobacterales bacterium]